MSSIQVVYGQKKQYISFQTPKSLLTLLRENGYYVDASCNGHGTCGKCKVTVAQDGTLREVLSCKIEASDGMCVYLPEIPDHGNIEGSAANASFEDRTGTPKGPYGTAVDLGTTTVVVRSFDLPSERNIGESRAWNRQRSYGADVMSRISHCMENENGREVLTKVIRDQVKDMILETLPEGSYPEKTVISGNTVMQMIFYGKDPNTLGKAPFIPETDFTAREEDVLFENDDVTYMPCISGFVGGDIVSGLSTLPKTDGPVLFMDLGTNGEMALLYGEKILTTAVAMGPAFEGAEISCGMPSLSGAVSHVMFNGKELMLETVNDAPPRGICGSGLLDLLSLLLTNHVVTENGRFREINKVPARFRRYLLPDGKGGTAFFLTKDRRVSLSSGDIRKLQLAIAAVRAGAELLTRHAGLSFSDLSKVIIAGGFGKELAVPSAVRVGLLPETCMKKCLPVGNTSLLGAEFLLLNKVSLSELIDMKNKADHLELSGDPEFNSLFAERMVFPSGHEEV